jgi:hypothetical protein
MALGRQEDVLAHGRLGYEPILEDRLGVPISFGGVEVADALAIRDAEQAIE